MKSLVCLCHNSSVTYCSMYRVRQTKWLSQSSFWTLDRDTGKSSGLFYSVKSWVLKFIDIRQIFHNHPSFHAWSSQDSIDSLTILFDSMWLSTCSATVFCGCHQSRPVQVSSLKIGKFYTNLNFLLKSQFNFSKM